MGDRIGVGVVGCGAAAQAIHVPALGSLPDDFEVRACFDAVPAVAATLAGRTHAHAAESLDALLSDPRVDVVLVCSPERFHAEHVVAACNAGKKAVVCEKPLADSTEAADQIVEASASTGVPVLVANMHLYDPAFTALRQRWETLESDAVLVRSTAFITPNARLVGWATEPRPEPKEWRPGAGPHPAELVQSVFWGLMIGLAIHHLPLVRLVMPSTDSVDVAMPLGVSGYHVSLRAGARIAQLTSMLYQFSANNWSIELWSPNRSARIEYPSGYLASQSATARLFTSAGGVLHEERIAAAHETGYRAEWRHLAQVVRGEASLRRGVADARDDIALAERVVWSFLERGR